jgi:hypothetical protein
VRHGRRIRRSGRERDEGWPPVLVVLALSAYQGF